MAAIARSGVDILKLRIYSKAAGRGASSYDVTVGLPDVIEVGFAGVKLVRERICIDLFYKGGTWLPGMD